MTNSLILEIQRDCISEEVSIGTILRKAKVAATKLDLTDFLSWINNEMNGYDYDNCPQYRRIYGLPQLMIHNVGTTKIIFENPEIEEKFSTMCMFQPITAIEKVIHNAPSQFIYYSFPPRLAGLFRGIFHQEAHMRFSIDVIENILDKVRDIILGWTLELDKQGILGEGMSFLKEERATAYNITNNIVAEHIGSFAGHTASDIKVIRENI